MVSHQVSRHKSVLLKEVLELLDIQVDDVLVDGTINGGGHSLAFAEKLSEKGTLIGIDLDPKALAVSQERLAKFSCHKYFIEGNFRDIDKHLKGIGIKKVDKFFLDLGWSSNQFEDAKRGFSFQKDGPLLMTLSGKDEGLTFTARDIVNDWGEDSLVEIFQSYGEERFAKRIAKRILIAREKKAIETTRELAQIIEDAVPLAYRRRKIHPATKVFQALRITVNDEIEALKEFLDKSFPLLQTGGRMAIISFHSIEDRIVKHFFREKEKEGLAQRINKKPIVASFEELRENPRSRSAKLRIIQKISKENYETENLKK